MLNGGTVLLKTLVHSLGIVLYSVLNQYWRTWVSVRFSIRQLYMFLTDYVLINFQASPEFPEPSLKIAAVKQHRSAKCCDDGEMWNISLNFTLLS